MNLITIPITAGRINQTSKGISNILLSVKKPKIVVKILTITFIDYFPSLPRILYITDIATRATREILNITGKAKNKSPRKPTQEVIREITDTIQPITEETVSKIKLKKSDIYHQIKIIYLSPS